MVKDLRYKTKLILHISLKSFMSAYLSGDGSESEKFNTETFCWNYIHVFFILAAFVKVNFSEFILYYDVYQWPGNIVVTILYFIR